MNDIVNKSFKLGEKILENMIVRKVMRSLLERFRPKVIAIAELVGSLQTYELNLARPRKRP